MPDLDPSSIPSSPSLSLVPSPNCIKPISNDAQNSMVRKTLNPNLVWKNRDKENKEKVEDSGTYESISDRSGSNEIAVKSLTESRCHLSFRVRAPKLVSIVLPVDSFIYLFN